MVFSDDFEHFHTQYIMEPIAHGVIWILRELELLAVQDVVVYVSNEMFSWHMLCYLSQDS